MEPGQIYEITVDLGPVAASIQPGHRLRVDISGADFPLYDRNPNTAEGIFSAKTAIATEQVHHHPGALSHIVLPVKDGEGNSTAKSMPPLSMKRLVLLIAHALVESEPLRRK